MKTLLYFLLAPFCATSAHAIDIVASGASGYSQVNLSDTYTQDFDSLLSVTGSGGTPWVNDVTIPGWYSTQSSYHANFVGGGLASYGIGSDRALGSISTNWELRFVNQSSQTISGFSVSFEAEQWYRAANSPQVATQLFFYYRIYAANISEAVEVDSIGGITNWTSVPALWVAAPNLSQPTAAFLDGNAIENSTDAFASVTGIDLAPGEKLWFKWVTGTPPGNPSALATDNLSVSFTTIPEPASLVALTGFGALAITALSRRNRR